MLEQQLTHDPADADPKDGLHAFVLATYADRRTSTLDYQIFGGIVQYGLGTWRPRDGYGIAVGTTHVNPNIANGQILANALAVGPGYVQNNEYVTEASVWMADDSVAELKTRRAIRHLSGRVYDPDKSQCVCAGR